MAGHRAAANSPASPQTGTPSRSRHRSLLDARRSRSAAACRAASQSGSLLALPLPVRAANDALRARPSAASNGSPSRVQAPGEPHRRCRRAGGNAPPPTPLVHSAFAADRDRDMLSNRPLTNIDELSCGCIPAHRRSVEPPTPALSTAASPRPRPASASPPSAVTPPAKQVAPNPPLSTLLLSEGVHLSMSPKPQFHLSPDTVVALHKIDELLRGMGRN